MELKVKDMSYGLLLSHTFPGLLFGLEILLAFELFTKLNIVGALLSIERSAANLISIFIISFVFSTLLGYILDGIHHYIFEDIRNIPYHSSPGFYKACNSVEKMQIYKHFLEDDLWYPYEAYANIGIAMLPGVILLPYWLNQLGVTTWFMVILSLLYIVVLIIMFCEAENTLKCFIDEEKVPNPTKLTG